MRQHLKMDNKALGDKLRLLFRNSVERVMLQIERALVPLAQGTTQTRLTWKSLGIDLSDQVFAQAVVDHINNNEKMKAELVDVYESDSYSSHPGDKVYIRYIAFDWNIK